MKGSRRTIGWTGMTVFAATILLFVPARGFASLVTIQASGITDLVSQPALNSLLGKSFSVTAIYSSTVADAHPDPNNGDYGAGLVSFSAMLDGQTLSSPSPSTETIATGNDLGSPFWDNFTILTFSEGLAISFPGLGPYDSATAALVLRDSTSSVFTDDSLPTSFNLGDFDLAFLSVVLQPPTNNFNTRIDATITSLQVTVSPEPIPEPTTLFLVALGVAGFGHTQRKKKRPTE